MNRTALLFSVLFSLSLSAGEQPELVHLNNDAQFETALKELQGNPPPSTASVRDQFDYRMKLAHAHTQLRQYDKAERLTREPLKDYPNWNFLHTILSVLLGKQGKYKEAEAEALRAIELEPDDTTYATLVLASWQWHLGKKDEALASIKSATENPSKTVSARLLHGCLSCFYASVGDEKQIEQHISEALKVGTRPDDADFFKRDVNFDPYRGKEWFIKLVGKTLAE